MGEVHATYLLRLNRMCELRGEGDMGDRYVVQNEIESERAACEVFPYESRDLHRSIQLSWKVYSML